MRKSQILSLFVCCLVPYTVGNGLIPLLPIYARQLGADSAIAGYYLAISYTAIAVGNFSAGWVSDKWQRRKIPMMIAGLVSIPLAWLMGRAGNIWVLTVLTATMWFCGGLGLGLISILTGLSAGEDERGKIFGFLSLAGGLGAFIGGLATGSIADRWGYPTMFTVMAGLTILWPLFGYFLTEKAVERTSEKGGPAEGGSGLGKSYYYLFTSCLIASIAGFIVLMGRSILMEDLEFKAFDVSVTGAVSGLVSMPLPLLIGWLSDRMDRKRFLYLGYLVGVISLAILAVSADLWHFVVVLTLQAIFWGAYTTLGNALVTDLLPQESLGRGLALFGTTTWIGGVLGFSGTGYALKAFGATPTFILGMCLPLIAMVILIPVRSRREVS